MATTQKKFLDQAGTGHLWSKIVNKLEEKADATTVSAIDTRLQNAESKIESLEAGIYDDSELRGLIGDNADAISALQDIDTAYGTRITTAENDLKTLKGNSTVEGSVAYQIAQIVNENNNGSIDTLNEIASWITNDTTGAAKMASDIQALQTAIGDNGSVSTQIANAINTALKVNGADKYALASELTALVTRVKALEDLGITTAKILAWDTVAAGSYDTAGAATEVYNAIIGLTNDEIDTLIAAASV